MIKKGLVVGVILLFISVAASSQSLKTPLAQSNIFSNDPVIDINGTIGSNGWYVSNVTVTMDDSYWYQLDNGSWIVYTAPFTISEDGRHLLKVTDNMTRNWIEEYEINIDQTPPEYVLLSRVTIFTKVRFSVECNDSVSGINRVEFYMDEFLRETDGEPPYEWIFYTNHYYLPFTLTAIIKKPQFSGDNITIPVIVGKITNLWTYYLAWVKVYDNAGNYWIESLSSVESVQPWAWSHRLFFQTVTVPNNYTGHLGQFFVKASFFDK